MILKNTLLSALILSLTALSACTQVPPPKAAVSQQNKQAEEAEETEALTELTYGKLEVRQVQEGSRAFSIEADQEDSLKIKIYETCEPTEKVLLTDSLKKGDEKKLFEGVMGLLSGKVEVKGLDPTTATPEQLQDRNLILSDIDGAQQKIILAPQIPSDQTLLDDLQKLVDGKVAQPVSQPNQQASETKAEPEASPSPSPSPSPSTTPTEA
jgi:hypothetical protein